LVGSFLISNWMFFKSFQTPDRKDPPSDNTLRTAFTPVGDSSPTGAMCLTLVFQTQFSCAILLLLKLSVHRQLSCMTWIYW